MNAQSGSTSISEMYGMHEEVKIAGRDNYEPEQVHDDGA